MEAHQLTIYTGDLDQVQIAGLFTWRQVIPPSFYIHGVLKVFFVILMPLVSLMVVVCCWATVLRCSSITCYNEFRLMRDRLMGFRSIQPIRLICIEVLFTTNFFAGWRMVFRYTIVFAARELSIGFFSVHGKHNSIYRHFK